MRKIAYLLTLGVLLATSEPVRGGTKEDLARLSSDVLALQNQIRMLEKSFSEHSEILKSLVGQMNDQVTKSNQILTKISQILDSQSSDTKSTNQTLLREIQKLSTRLDENSTRISALAQQITEMKVQTKELNPRKFESIGSDPAGATAAADTIFAEAYNDFIQGNLEFAIRGFTAFVGTYPTNEKADDAQYYIGEAYYNGRKLAQAIAAFSRVMNDYPNGDKVASAQFKRGKAELDMAEKENAIEDFKAVISNFPASPEAGLAKSQLDVLGVDLSKQAKPVSKKKP